MEENFVTKTFIMYILKIIFMDMKLNNLGQMRYVPCLAGMISTYKIF
jgi:hypothetical protein